MSWTPDLYIGESRPWPDAVYVIRSRTGEKRRYVLPERTCKLVREHFESSGAHYRLVCSECHHVIWDGWQEKPVRYCAFCGAKVVDA